MLLPDELKRAEFSRAIRGYSAAEVDDYIDFLLEKYHELDQKNDELERKLAVATNRLNGYREREEQLVEMKKEAQRISAQLIAGAEAKSGRIMNEAETYCRSVMTDLDEKVAQKRAVVDRLASVAEDFKDKLFAMYSEHIEMLEKTAALADSAFDSVVEISRDCMNHSPAPQTAPASRAANVPAPDPDMEMPAEESGVAAIGTVETPHELFQLDDVSKRARAVKEASEYGRAEPEDEMSLTSEFELVYASPNRRRADGTNTRDKK